MENKFPDSILWEKIVICFPSKTKYFGVAVRHLLGFFLLYLYHDEINPVQKLYDYQVLYSDVLLSLFLKVQILFIRHI
jgi:hypothetical protein